MDNMDKLVTHQRLLFEIGRLLKRLEVALDGRYKVVETDFQKPFVKLVPMINAATERGLLQKNPKLDSNIATIMCWVSDADWISELIPPMYQMPTKMGYSFGYTEHSVGEDRNIHVLTGNNINMYTDGDLLSASEYAQKYNVSVSTIKARAASGCMLTARKVGDRWAIDGDEPFVP